jgi:hypothetical protein
MIPFLAMTDAEQVLLSLASPAVSIVGLLFTARYLAGRQSRAVEDLGKGLEALTATTNQQVSTLSAAISSEREDRHADFRSLTERDGRDETNLAENYPKRRETIRQFATLMQRMNEQHAEVIGEIKALPCVGPKALTAPALAACPARREEPHEP